MTTCGESSRLTIKGVLMEWQKGSGGIQDKKGLEPLQYNLSFVLYLFTSALHYNSKPDTVDKSERQDEGHGYS